LNFGLGFLAIMMAKIENSMILFLISDQ